MLVRRCLRAASLASRIEGLVKKRPDSDIFRMLSSAAVTEPPGATEVISACLAVVVGDLAGDGRAKSPSMWVRRTLRCRCLSGFEVFAEEPDPHLSLSSLVRLQLLDECHMVRRDPGQSAFVKLTLEERWRIADRELVRLLDLLAVENRECADEVVERRSEVPEYVSYEDADPFRRLLGLDTKDVLAAVEVWVAGDSVRAAVAESSDLGLECLDVFASPVDLRPGVI